MKGVIGLLAGMLLLAPQAIAADTPPTVYAQADVSNVILAMLRGGALDPNDAMVRKDYLLTRECALYRANYANEFQMRRIEEAAAKAIAQNRASWPNAFTFDSPLQLDHYDFKSQQYMLNAESQLLNVNSFILLRSSDTSICIPGKQFNRFPAAVGVRIDQPVSIPGLPLSQAAGEALLQRLMAAGGPANKQVYARFSIAVTFMPPIEAMLRPNETKLARYNFDGRLMKIEFFEDGDYQKPIWTLTR